MNALRADNLQLWMALAKQRRVALKDDVRHSLVGLGHYAGGRLWNAPGLLRFIESLRREHSREERRGARAVVRLDEHAASARHEHAEQLAEESLGIREVVERVDGVKPPHAAVVELHVLGIQDQVEVGGRHDVAEQHVGIVLLEQASPRADLDALPLAGEPALVGVAAEAVELAENAAEHCLFAEDLQVHGDALLAVEIDAGQPRLRKHPAERAQQAGLFFLGRHEEGNSAGRPCAARQPEKNLRTKASSKMVWIISGSRIMRHRFSGQLAMILSVEKCSTQKMHRAVKERCAAVRIMTAAPVRVARVAAA